MTRAQLDKKPVDVASMFDTVAEKYDRTNDVLSLGQDRRWRKAVVAKVAAQRGERILDIAAGTGTSSEPWADREIEVVPADFSLGMLRVGNRRRPDMAFTAADAMRLPFADESFDVVTMSFGLRNVSNIDAALREFARVAKPGGRLVVCEFSQPVNRAFRTVYSKYLLQPGVLRLPRRVHPRVADAGGARPRHRGRRLEPGGLDQPQRRGRRAAHRGQARLSAGLGRWTGSLDGVTAPVRMPLGHVPGGARHGCAPRCQNSLGLARTGSRGWLLMGHGTNWLGIPHLTMSGPGNRLPRR